MTSRSSQERTSAALAAIPDAESLTAILVSQSGTTAVVNQGTGSISVRSSSQYPLIPGDSVRLERRDGDVVMTGPARPRSATGRVTATGTPRCTVEYPSGSGVTMQMPFNAAYTPAVNDTVLISWDPGGGVVECKLTALPTTGAPPPVGAPSPVEYRQIFTAIDGGSYRSSWSKSEVIASVSGPGAWFYGSKIVDTIPDTATISAALIYLPLKQVLAQDSPVFGRHNLPSKSGAPTFAAAAALEPRSGWIPIPLSLIDFLKANAGGLGFITGYSYTIWAGPNEDGLSGALDITYTV